MQTISSPTARSSARVSIRRRLACCAGLTLVELLVTVSIIAILATIFLGALQMATEDAKVMKTKSMIVKLNNLIMPRYEAYRTRRVPLNISVTGPSALTPVVAARARLDALHELMRLEMPDRWSDVYNPMTNNTTYPTFQAQITPITPGMALPSLNQAYYNAYIAHAAAGGSFPSLTYQNAETLYMIVTLGFVDELGGRDLFNESNVGDADGDGYPEFIDAWGTPIRFLRWAPGFTDSELNGAGGVPTTASGNTVTILGNTTPGSTFGLAKRPNAYVGKTLFIYTPPMGATPAVKQVATITSSTYNSDGLTTLQLPPTTTITLNGGETFGIDPYQFDPAQAYPNGVAVPAVPFAIYPLIYSAGPNKTFGIVSDLSAPINYGLVNNFPFLTDGNGQSVGTESDSLATGGGTSEQGTVSGWEASGWLDNIHNHMIGTR